MNVPSAVHHFTHYYLYTDCIQNSRNVKPQFPDFPRFPNVPLTDPVSHELCVGGVLQGPPTRLFTEAVCSAVWRHLSADCPAAVLEPEILGALAIYLGAQRDRPPNCRCRPEGETQREPALGADPKLVGKGEHNSVVSVYNVYVVAGDSL